MLDTEVVLTKMKFFSNIPEKLLVADDSLSTISTPSVSDQAVSPTNASNVNSDLDDKSRQPWLETGSDYLSAIFSESDLPRLYKFESEDSGVELPSGANSPSTPTGSEQSFVVHSRESSCDSCNLNSDPSTLPDEHSSECKQKVDSATVDNGFILSEDLSSSSATVELHIGEDTDQCGASKTRPEKDKEISEQHEETTAVTQRMSLEDTRQQPLTGACDEFETKPLRRSATIDSLKEYMDECCSLSEVRQPPCVNNHSSSVLSRLSKEALMFLSVAPFSSSTCRTVCVFSFTHCSTA